MKQFLRPVGTCLTTAVMTSTLLESAALALPDFTSHPEGLADPTTELSISSQDLAPVAPGALPIAPPEALPAVERSVEPSSTGAERLPTSTPADRSETSVAPTAEEGAIASPEAIATIRRLLDEKLAALVAQDRPLKEAQLRDNLIAYALHYAEIGEWEQARQTAQNPALSEQDQAKLMAQIEALATQNPVADASPDETLTEQPETAIASVPVPTRWALPTFGHAPTAFCPVPPTVQPQPIQKPGIELAADWSNFTLTPNDGTQPKALPPTPVILERVVVSATPPVSLPEVQQSLDLAQRPDSIAPTLAQTPILTAADLQAVPQSLQPQTLERSPRVEDPSIATPAAVIAPPDALTPKPLASPLALLPSALPSLVGQWITPEQWAGSVGDRRLSPRPTPNPSDPLMLPSPVGAGIEALATPSVLSLGQRLLTDVELATAFLPDGPQKQWQVPTKAAKSVQNAVTPGSCGGLSPVVFNLGTQVNTLLAQQLQRLGVMFPLPIPAAITSAFGWRIHPIFGTRRFHEGVDFGAPHGTPVLAATAGRVVAAESMGGYGLTVIIENDTTAHRNLYAHLSGIAVQPGADVEQGMVIGWVGSTGNSTGPHLHFEFQQRTASGWSAIDPIALANSVRN